jgi:D-alanyl-D-alanine dipeptidase
VLLHEKRIPNKKEKKVNLKRNRTLMILGFFINDFTMQTVHKIKLIGVLSVLALCSAFNRLIAQQVTVIGKNKTYWQEVQADSLQKMVEVKTLIPSVIYDLRYATPENFTGKQLYKKNDHTFLRLEVLKALSKVQEQLTTSGHGLKIFDAYRPYRVTKKMWELVHDERYVANPQKGSGHNRGLAVDLTIIDLKTGRELNMGTGFDNFTDTAHQTFTNLPPDMLANRRLLRETMEKFGFKALETEWWHYSWPNDRDYKVLDLDFKTLQKKAR